MTWPLSDPGCVITDDFTGHSSGRPQHYAWDVGAEYGSSIYAPERGQLLLHFAIRSKAGNVTLIEDYVCRDGTKYPFSWYWADRYGACVVLLGETWWWLFAHVQLPDLFNRAFAQHSEMRPYKWRNVADPQEFYELYTNERDMFVVAEGEQIGLIGDSGYSTGAHTHLEVYPPGGGTRDDRIDPKVIWPDQYTQRLE